MEALNQLSETKLISLDITEAKRAVASVVCQLDHLPFSGVLQAERGAMASIDRQVALAGELQLLPVVSSELQFIASSSAATATATATATAAAGGCDVVRAIQEHGSVRSDGPTDARNRTTRTSNRLRKGSIGSEGSGAGQLTNPFGVCESEGLLYVADYNNRRIQVYDLAN
jgi:hypothetical protein